MPTSAFILVLAAACAHAAWNIIAHGASRTGVPFLWWGSVTGTVLWLGVIPVTGGIGGGSGGVDWGGFALGASVSAVLHVAYMFVLQRGYAVGDLSTVYATARGTGPLLTVIVAVTVLGERPSPLALAGVLVVVCGIVSIGIIGRPMVSAGSIVRERSRGRRRLDPSIVAGLVTGVAIAAYTIWDAHALREWQLSPVAFMVGCTALEIPLFTVAVWKRRAELMLVLRAQWGRLLAFGVLSPLSYILVLTAITIAPVALVAPVREVSVVLVSLFGALVFREHRPVARVAASVVVVGGIVLLSLPG
ncbi:EamA family transporter [Leucobacter sp. NPDC058333]|uniref:EamA family transporter n=1 Tax=Leucobacter sp. NPDC058333 TaxID=3346450 RepID=UPI0036663442